MVTNENDYHSYAGCHWEHWGSSLWCCNHLNTTYLMRFDPTLMNLHNIWLEMMPSLDEFYIDNDNFRLHSFQDNFFIFSQSQPDFSMGPYFLIFLWLLSFIQWFFPRLNENSLPHYFSESLIYKTSILYLTWMSHYSRSNFSPNYNDLGFNPVFLISFLLRIFVGIQMSIRWHSDAYLFYPYAQLTVIAVMTSLITNKLHNLHIEDALLK